jgi:hypothetical protein
MVLIKIYTRGELFIFEFLTLSMCFVLSESGGCFYSILLERFVLTGGWCNTLYILYFETSDISP